MDFITFLKLLPELIGLVKTLMTMIDRGVTILEVKSRVNSISKALDNPDRREAARQLNDVFRK